LTMMFNLCNIRWASTALFEKLNGSPAKLGNVTIECMS
jgi:hypothetical protein